MERETATGLRLCTRKNHNVPYSLFYKSAGRYSAWCIPCHQEYHKEQRQAEQIKKVARQYSANDPRVLEAIKRMKEATVEKGEEEWETPKAERPAKWPPAILDWLTPIWGFEDRTQWRVE